MNSSFGVPYHGDIVTDRDPMHGAAVAVNIPVVTAPAELTGLLVKMASDKVVLYLLFRLNCKTHPWITS